MRLVDVPDDPGGERAAPVERAPVVVDAFQGVLPLLPKRLLAGANVESHHGDHGGIGALGAGKSLDKHVLLLSVAGVRIQGVGDRVRSG